MAELSTGDHPNILLIHADQHRYDCLGAYGNPDLRTPNVDALARDGVLYRNSFCCYPVCTPSRYSLLSGLYVHQHLGWTNRSTLLPQIATLPRVLREAGYRTSAVGKMHFTPTYLDVGFQEMALTEQDGPGRHDDDYHRWLAQQGLCDRLDLMDQVRAYRERAPQSYWDAYGALASDLDEAHYSTTWIAERALEALMGWGKGGQMLMVGFIKPHHPCDPPAPWDGMYDPVDLTLPLGWTESCPDHDVTYGRGHFDNGAMSEQQFRQAMAFYYATVSQIDHHVGRFVDCLRRKGLYDNTLIVYTSDHGDYVGHHHMILKGGYMYDPLIKVPLVLKYPGQENAGQTSDALVSNIDLAPTLLRCAGCDTPPSMRGLDLRAFPEGRDVVFAEARGGAAYMARTATHKLLLCRDSTQSQFFDLERDPLEMQNRIGDPGCADQVDLLQSSLLRWALFNAPSGDYRDQAAPLISGENVPAGDDGHWEQSAAYYRACKQEWVPDAAQRATSSRHGGSG